MQRRSAAECPLIKRDRGRGGEARRDAVTRRNIRRDRATPQDGRRAAARFAGREIGDRIGAPGTGRKVDIGDRWHAAAGFRPPAARAGDAGAGITGVSGLDRRPRAGIAEIGRM
jgi:hypothetical protein